MNGWYVYDHYDELDKITGTPSTADIRAYTAQQVSTWMGTARTNVLPIMKLQTWVEGPKPHNYSSNANSVTLGAFDQHIYNHTQNDVSYFDFVGYGSNSFSGFMYFPCTSSEAKEVTFDIDATNVNSHSLNGAGVLINAGITDDANKYLQGYYLYFTYGTDNMTQPTDVTLYRINDNCKAADLHNATVDSGGGDSTLRGIVANSSVVESLTISAAHQTTPITWSPQMAVRLTITPTNVRVELKQKGAGAYTAALN